jgi:hypothetical protein
LNDLFPDGRQSLENVICKKMKKKMGILKDNIFPKVGWYFTSNLKRLISESFDRIYSKQDLPVQKRQNWPEWHTVCS